MGSMTFQHMNWWIMVLEGTISLLIIFKILSAHRGKELFIRKIPGLNAIDEAVGRSTEMGRPILFNLGLYGLDIVTLQALAIGAYVARLAARYNTRIIVPVCEPTVLPVAEEAMREAYTAEGKPELFNPDDIRFLSNDQFAYASGVVGLINREKVASNFMFGYYFAEALIMAEAGFQAGAIQVAGTPATTQIPFLIAACDYTIIGDEYYAATAYLTRQPTLLGSLVGQDYSKILLLSLILIGITTVTIWGDKNNAFTQLFTDPDKAVHTVRAFFGK